MLHVWVGIKLFILSVQKIEHLARASGRTDPVEIAFHHQRWDPNLRRRVCPVSSVAAKLQNVIDADLIVNQRIGSRRRRSGSNNSFVMGGSAALQIDIRPISQEE